MRTVLAWTTLCCLLIQLIPVAPPRMIPGIGIVDTGLRYNQSVYSHGLPIDQLSAMPSVHVAWAVLRRLLHCGGSARAAGAGSVRRTSV